LPPPSFGLPWYNDTAKKASHQSNTNQSGIILSLSEKLQLSPAKFPNKHFTNDHGIVSVSQWKPSKYAATAGCSIQAPCAISDLPTPIAARQELHRTSGQDFQGGFFTMNHTESEHKPI